MNFNQLPPNLDYRLSKEEEKERMDKRRFIITTVISSIAAVGAIAGFIASVIK